MACSQQTLDQRATAALSELTALFKDAKHLSCHLATQASMWEQEAISWKSRGEAQAQRCLKLEAELSSARRQLRACRVAAQQATTSDSAPPLPRLHTLPDASVLRRTAMMCNADLGGPVGGLLPLPNHRSSSSPPSPHRSRAYPTRRSLDQPATRQAADLSICEAFPFTSQSSANDAGTGPSTQPEHGPGYSPVLEAGPGQVTRRNTVNLSSLMSMFMAASLMQLDGQQVEDVAACDSHPDDQSEDDSGIGQAAVSVEVGDGLSGVGVAAAAAVSAAAARAWASAATGQQRRSATRFGMPRNVSAAGSVGGVSGGSGSVRSNSGVKRRSSKAGYKLIASINRFRPSDKQPRRGSLASRSNSTGHVPLAAASHLHPTHAASAAQLQRCDSGQGMADATTNGHGQEHTMQADEALGTAFETQHQEQNDNDHHSNVTQLGSSTPTDPALWSDAGGAANPAVAEVGVIGESPLVRQAGSGIAAVAAAAAAAAEGRPLAMLRAQPLLAHPSSSVLVRLNGSSATAEREGSSTAVSVGGLPKDSSSLQQHSLDGGAPTAVTGVGGVGNKHDGERVDHAAGSSAVQESDADSGAAGPVITGAIHNASLSLDAAPSDNLAGTSSSTQGSAYAETNSNASEGSGHSKTMGDASSRQDVDFGSNGLGRRPHHDANGQAAAQHKLAADSSSHVSGGVAGGGRPDSDHAAQLAGKETRSTGTGQQVQAGPYAIAARAPEAEAWTRPWQDNEEDQSAAAESGSGSAGDKSSSASSEPAYHWDEAYAPKTTTLSLHWLTPPKTVLLVCKLTPKVQPYFACALRWCRAHGLTVYVEPAMWDVVRQEAHASMQCLQNKEQRTQQQTQQESGVGAGKDATGESSLLTQGANASRQQKQGQQTLGRQKQQQCSAQGDGSNKGQAVTCSTLWGCLPVQWPWEQPQQPQHQQRQPYRKQPSTALSSGSYVSSSADLDSNDAGPGSGQVTVPEQDVCAPESSVQCKAIDGVMTWRGASPCSPDGTIIPDDIAHNLDFVLVLGGDGTLLWTCHIFGNRAMPPLLPFNLGSLGFLTPFAPEELPLRLSKAVEGGFPMILRHRLHCIIVRAKCRDQVQPQGSGPKKPPCSASTLAHWEDGHCSSEKVVLNEVVIDRGTAPFLTNLEAFCDGYFVTHVQGDGLIVATPTGSTAYNLAAGGSMLHPQVPGILFTPICPHSLSFRPLVFPDHVQLCVQVPQDSRAEMWCSFDGKDRQPLRAGDAIIIRSSRWPIPTVCSSDPSRDWFMGVREGLHWNSRRVQAGAGQ